MMKEKKNTYILSLEASEIFKHLHWKDYDFKREYIGMIPFSLELMKLKKEGLKTFTVKTSDKEMSNDLINVKFKRKAKSARHHILYLQEKMEKLERKIEELQKEEKENKKLKKLIEQNEKLKVNLEHLKKNIDNPLFQEISNSELRRKLYEEGFTIKFKNETVKYVVYKRSSSKSRKGECLFIREELYERMMNWSRLDLDFSKLENLDYPSLLAYESLVGSSLEDTVQINPKNILIVDDVYSTFKKNCAVVKKDRDRLRSIEGETTVSNSLFDGESLLHKDYFPEDKSMLLLRNHFFKSAAFNTDIQQFLRDHCPEDIEFENWYIKDMFNNSIKASDIHLITTPSSLKLLKFSNLFDSPNEMFKHWKNKVKEDGNIFGVCKAEKKSKRGTDENGNVLQQLSYQMINSLPMTENDIDELLEFEKNYIHNLKNDDEAFVQFLEDEATEVDANQMIVDLYRRNSDIANTELFKNIRKKKIHNYVNRVKSGKIRVAGDYAVMLGNPREFLLHAIDQFDIEKTELELKENEVHTKLFDFDLELVGFRNPHTAQSNVLIVKNKKSAFVEKYFNLTENIVVVNSINFALQDILSGSDFDSDTLLLINNEKMLSLARKCYGKYPVVINKVESQRKNYQLTKHDMYLIDNQLSESQMTIGVVTNTAQQLLSLYWDSIATNDDEREREKMMDNLNVLIALSGISIDLAKKLYDIDIQSEINRIKKETRFKTKDKEINGKKRKVEVKPLFFEYISQNKTIKEKTVFHECPMDYLYITKFKKANEKRNSVELKDLLEKCDKRNADRKQSKKIVTYIEEMKRNLNAIHNNNQLEKQEKYLLQDNILKEYHHKIAKLKVKPDTMYNLLQSVVKCDSDIALLLMNMLYRTHKETFINTFVKK